MHIGGHNRCEGKRSGGISSIELIEVAGIYEMDYDRDSDSFVYAEVEPDYSFKAYHFKEGEAEYSEQISVKDGLTMVTHKLVFSLERIDSESGRAIAELIAASKDGLLTIVTTSNGVRLMVGYSRKFGGERPLKLVSGDCSTGRLLGDDTLRTIVLQSEDDAEAKRFDYQIE